MLAPISSPTHPRMGMERTSTHWVFLSRPCLPPYPVVEVWSLI